jgi:hypothetical protein
MVHDGTISIRVNGGHRRVTAGIMWPHKLVTTIDGEIVETTWVKSYEINGKVPKVLTK